MKKLAILAITLFAATSAFAQADPGDMGIFADQAGTQTSANPPVFDANQAFYVVMFGVDVAAWENCVHADPAVTLISPTFNPPNAVNVGSAPNFIVGTGTCLPSGGGAVWLMRHTYGLFSGAPPADFVICFGGASPSSFPNGEAGYLDCQDNLINVGTAQNGDPNYDNGCLVLHPQSEPPVGTGDASFGSVKGRF